VSLTNRATFTMIAWAVGIFFKFDQIILCGIVNATLGATVMMLSGNRAKATVPGVRENFLIR